MAVITVSAKQLTENYNKLRAYLGETQLFAVVKAEGYGLGTQWLTKTLYDAGQRIFCTARAKDALFIKGLYPDTEVWLCSVYEESGILKELIVAGVVVCVDSIRVLQTVENLAGEDIANINIAVDTGMGRNGLRKAEVKAFAAAYKDCSHLKVVSTFTHYANCFGHKEGKKKTFAQYANFCDVVTAMLAEGIDPGLRHASNSAAALLYPEIHLDGVRIGSALLGRSVGVANAELQPVGTMTAAVTSVRTLCKGETIGYGSVFTAKHNMTIAMVEVGHTDGAFVTRAQDGFRLLDRLFYAKRALLANSLSASFGDRRLPIVGRVGLTDLAVDVTGTEIIPGDRLTLSFNPVLCAGQDICYE